MARGERGLRAVGRGIVRGLDEAGPARVRLPVVQDARDLDVAAPVQADAPHAEPVIAEPGAARPRRQLRDRPLALGGALPRRAHRQREPEPKAAPAWRPRNSAALGAMREPSSRRHAPCRLSPRASARARDIRVS